MMCKDFLEKIYYDPLHPGSNGGVDKTVQSGTQGKGTKKRKLGPPGILAKDNKTWISL